MQKEIHFAGGEHTIKQASLPIKHFKNLSDMTPVEMFMVEVVF